MRNDLIQIELNSHKIIKGLTNIERKRVEEDLTFDNPAYLNALRYSKYNSVSLPQYLYLFREIPEGIEVPIGYSLYMDSLCPTVDNRTCEVTSFPPLVLGLREDQRKARDAFVQMNSGVEQRGVVCLGTGKGKSLTGLAIAHQLQAKTLIVVHKSDLVDSWTADIKQFIPNSSIGYFSAGKKTVGEHFTIATVQTLNRVPESQIKVLQKTFSMIILDEGHHVGAGAYDIVTNFNARYKLLLTATPERNDGLTHLLYLHFGKMCYQSEYIEEEEEDILPVDVKVQEVETVYYNPICFRTKNNGTARLVETERSFLKFPKLKPKECLIKDVPFKKRPKISYHTVEDIVLTSTKYGTMVLRDILKEYEAGRSIVVFISQKVHCELYYDNIAELIGEENVQLYYGDSKESNKELVRRAESGEVKITITTLAKGTEGTNVKAWEVAFLVSSINNGKNVEQAVGRIRRVKEGKIDRCLVYDYRVPNVYSMSRHGSTRDERYIKMKCRFI